MLQACDLSASLAGARNKRQIGPFHTHVAIPSCLDDDIHALQSKNHGVQTCRFADVVE